MERAICGPLQTPKQPKMAILGSFSQFDAHLAIFLAGTRWNSPLKVKIEAMSGVSPTKKALLGPLQPLERPKMAHFGPVDHFLAWIKVELTH